MPVPLPSPSGASLSDMIHRLRLLVDQHTPGPGTASELMGGPLGWLMLGADKGAMPTAQILNNHPVAGSAAPPAAPAAQPPAQPSAPSVNVPALGGLGLFPAAASQPNTMLQAAQSYMAHPQAPSPAPAPAAPAPTPPPAMAQRVPLPAPSAPQDPSGGNQPDTGFFMRNALMMQDPNGGGYIDPQGAASVRGPDLIKKMTAYLHNKDMG